MGLSDVSTSQERNLECPRHVGRNTEMPAAFFNFWRVARVNDVLIAQHVSLKTNNFVVLYITLTMLGREAGFSAEL